jgi:hypothetical protein
VYPAWLYDWRMGASLTIAAGSEGELARVVRETLHLAEDDRVIVERRDGEVVLRREEPGAARADDQLVGQGLIRENGLLVYDSGADIAEGDVLRWIDEDRERRMKYISGIVDEP